MIRLLLDLCFSDVRGMMHNYLLFDEMGERLETFDVPGFLPGHWAFYDPLTGPDRSAVKARSLGLREVEAHQIEYSEVLPVRQ